MLCLILNSYVKKITEIYPEIVVCGINIDVTKDNLENTWVVHLRKETHKLDHFLEFVEAKYCMDGKQYVSLGLEIAQLQNNIEGKQY